MGGKIIEKSALFLFYRKVQKIVDLLDFFAFRDN